MTNGEMIQKIFNCEVCEPIPEEDIIHVIFPDKNDSAIGFDWSWWNMEHKASTTKNDLEVDCISRAEVLKLMQDNWHTHNGDWAMQESMDDIRALPPVAPQEPRWIPVSERLPEERVYEDGHTEPSERVLVQLTNGEMHVSRYWTQWVCDSPWIDILYLYINKVVAWMPLPKQYDPQESEG